MANTIDIAALAGGRSLDPAVQRDPQKVKQAAEQFEAMLIQQMFQSAHAAGGGSFMGEDETNSTMTDMAEQQFAQMLASSGGIGLAKLVSQGLERK